MYVIKPRPASRCGPAMIRRMSRRSGSLSPSRTCATQDNGNRRARLALRER